MIRLGVIAVSVATLVDGCGTLPRARQREAVSNYENRFTSACTRMHSDRVVVEQRFGAPASGSSEDAEQLKPTLKDTIVLHDGDVRRCYEAALFGWPNLEGRIAMRFVIDPQGTVLAAYEIANSTGVDAVACCIAEAMRGWTFLNMNRKGSVVVIYPYTLEIARDS